MWSQIPANVTLQRKKLSDCRVLLATLATLCLVLGAARIDAGSSESQVFLLTEEVAPAVQKKSFADKSDSRPSSPIFTEVADQAGLDFQHYNGMTGQFYLPEIM